MHIKNHLINGLPLFAKTPNTSGPLINPTLLVMHYTASGQGGDKDAKYLSTPAAKASAHVVMDAKGTTFQIAPFNIKTWHAGKSIWRGRPNCNDYSIGIEIDNFGILQRRADGNCYSWTGVHIPDERVVHARHKNGNDGYWEAYPEAQLRALEELTRALLEAYPSIKEIVGHEDIAPGRKTDPGPAFPMSRFQAILGRGDHPHEQLRTVLAGSLNVRADPSPNGTIIGSLKKGDTVAERYDAGDWSQVSYGDVTGWVADKWLTN